MNHANDSANAPVREKKNILGWFDFGARALLPVALFFLGLSVDKARERTEDSRLDAARAEREFERERLRQQQGADRATRLIASLSSPNILERRVALAMSKSFKNDSLLSGDIVAAVQQVHIVAQQQGDIETAKLAASVLDSVYRKAVVPLMQRGERFVHDADEGWVLIGLLSERSKTWIERSFNGPEGIKPNDRFDARIETMMYAKHGGTTAGNFDFSDSDLYMLRTILVGEEVQVESIDTVRGRSDTSQVWAKVRPQFVMQWSSNP